MLNFFQSIVDYVQMAWQFFLNTISSLFYLVRLVIGAGFVPQSSIAFLFGPLAACVLAVTAVGVLKLLIGRENV